MSKELSPLEALNELFEDFMIMRNCLYDLDKDTQESRDFYIKWANEHKIIIENALKERKELKKCLKSEMEHSAFLNRERLKDSKKLKALEIIKNRAEDDQFGLLCLEKEPSGRYCLTIDTHIRTLTREEYNLLKEVLL